MSKIKKAILKIISSILLGTGIIFIFSPFLLSWWIHVGPRNLLFSVALPGFISSFFIRKNSLVFYFKLIFFNSLFFGFLFALVFVLYVSIADSQSQINLIGFFLIFLIFTISNFLSGLAGIVPKELIEKLKTAKINS